MTTHTCTGRIALDDVEWLLDAGESIWQIARRMHCTIAGITKAARRAGRIDIVRRIEGAATAEKRARRAAA